MLIVRFLLFAAPVVAAIILAAVAGEWLLVAIAAVALLIATAALFSQMLHYHQRRGVARPRARRPSCSARASDAL